MIDLLLYLLLGIAGIVVGVNYLRRFFLKKNNLGIDGKLIWVDKGRSTRPFYNKAFEVLSKPDLMYKVREGVLAVEYKSRRRRIVKSDIVQAKCAALAARGSGYKVVRILVKTATNELYVNLPKIDKALFDEIEEYVALARQSKTGAKMEAWPENAKCRSCAFRNECSYTQQSIPV